MSSEYSLIWLYYPLSLIILMWCKLWKLLVRRIFLKLVYFSLSLTKNGQLLLIREKSVSFSTVHEVCVELHVTIPKWRFHFLLRITISCPEPSPLRRSRPSVRVQTVQRYSGSRWQWLAATTTPRTRYLNNFSNCHCIPRQEQPHGGGMLLHRMWDVL